MDTDLMLVSGIILGVMSIPAMLSAFTEGRAKARLLCGADCGHSDFRGLD